MNDVFLFYFVVQVHFPQVQLTVVFLTLTAAVAVTLPMMKPKLVSNQPLVSYNFFHEMKSPEKKRRFYVILSLNYYAHHSKYIIIWPKKWRKERKFHTFEIGIRLKKIWVNLWDFLFTTTNDYATILTSHLKYCKWLTFINYANSTRGT